MGHANYTAARNGKSAAICCCCNRNSRPVEVCSDGEPDLWKMPQGWSQAPFSVSFQHRDGSTGSTYTCPACNKRLRRGETLKLRGGVTANAADKVSKGRLRYGVSQGQKHGHSKLTDAEVLAILSLREEGKPLKQIADSFAVTEGCISKICNRRHWRHI